MSFHRIVWVAATCAPPLLVLLRGRDGVDMLVGRDDPAAVVGAWCAVAWPFLIARGGVRAGVTRAWSELGDPTARAGAVLTVVLVAAAVFASLVAVHDPGAMGDPVADRYLAPGSAHWMGTDLLGRDLFSRVVHGARVSLGIAVASVVVSLLLGVGVGAGAAWFGGWADGMLMRATDLALAFPRIFLVLLLVAIVEPAPIWIVAVLGATGWMGIARVVRGQVLQQREVDYVLAARALGVPSREVVARHVLPAVMGPVLATTTLRVGNAILAESFLSFLGLGVQDPWVSWGMLIRAGRDTMLDAWWLTLFPGIAIVLTVLGFNLLGDGLRHAVDPRASTRTTGWED